MKTGKENDNTEQEYRPRGVLLGPIPYTLDRVSEAEIEKQELLMRLESPGVEIIRAFDSEDVFCAHVLGILPTS